MLFQSEGRMTMAAVCSWC